MRGWHYLALYVGTLTALIAIFVGLAKFAAYLDGCAL